MGNYFLDRQYVLLLQYCYMVNNSNNVTLYSLFTLTCSTIFKHAIRNMPCPRFLFGESLHRDGHPFWTDSKRARLT